GRAFEAHPVHPSTAYQQVLIRFQHVAKAMQTGPMVLPRQLIPPLPTLPETPQARTSYIALARAIWHEKAHSVAQALMQATQWQQVAAKEVAAGLLAEKKEVQTQFALLLAREQQVILNTLLKDGASPLTLRQQLFLLDTLVDAQCHDLNLTAF